MPAGSSASLMLPGRQLLVGDKQGCITLWDVATAKALHEFSLAGGGVSSVVVAGDGRSAWALAGEHLLHLDLRAGRVIWSTVPNGIPTPPVPGEAEAPDPFGRHVRIPKTGDIYALASVGRQGRIAVCCESRSLWLLDGATGKEIWNADLPEGRAGRCGLAGRRADRCRRRRPESLPSSMPRQARRSGRRPWPHSATPAWASRRTADRSSAPPATCSAGTTRRPASVSFRRPRCRSRAARSSNWRS